MAGAACGGAAGADQDQHGLMCLSAVQENPEAERNTSRPLLLSPRELACLRLVAWGLTGRGVARELGITVATVKSHLARVRGKLAARSTCHAVALAVVAGWVEVVDGERVAAS